MPNSHFSSGIKMHKARGINWSGRSHKSPAPTFGRWATVSFSMLIPGVINHHLLGDVTLKGEAGDRETVAWSIITNSFRT